MDELPRNARAFLDLTRDAHDPPDPHARERVQARLAAALAPAAAGVAAGSAQRAARAATPGGTWLAAPKLLVAVAVAVVTGGAWIGSRPTHQAPDEARVAQQQAADEVSVSAPPQVAPSVEPIVAMGAVAARRADARTGEASAAPAKVTHATGAVQASRSLAEEMQLLEQASNQLSQQRVATALQALAQHRRRFGRSAQLLQERDGLFALAQCLAEQPRAKLAAQRYLARVPGSVLATRLETACGL